MREEDEGDRGSGIVVLEVAFGKIVERRQNVRSFEVNWVEWIIVVFQNLRFRRFSKYAFVEVVLI